MLVLAIFIVIRSFDIHVSRQGFGRGITDIVANTTIDTVCRLTQMIGQWMRFLLGENIVNSILLVDTPWRRTIKHAGG